MKGAMAIQHHDKRCEFCAFWRRGDRMGLVNIGRENAYCTDLPSEHYGTCICGKFVYVARHQQAPVDGLGYEDGEGCQAAFYTGEGFGCRHWKESMEE